MRAFLLPIVFVLASDVAAPERREAGSLVTEDVPEIPARVIDRTNQYTNTRSALLVDFDPDGTGILTATRFGETFQLHHVDAPNGDRQQLTFFPEPVTSGAYDPAAAGGFFIRIDTGGNEAYQYHWFDREAGRSTLVTDGKSRNEGLLVANKGGKAAYVSTRRNKKDFDLYVMDGHAPDKSRLVKELAGQWSPLDWDAQDQRLLVERYVSVNESYLHVVNVTSGEMIEINPRDAKSRQTIAYSSAVFSRTADAVYYASDEGSEFQRLVHHDLKANKKTVLTPKLDWDVTAVAISKDGKTLAYASNEGGTSGLYLAPTSDPTKATKIALPPAVISRIMFDAKGTRLGFSMTTAQSPADVFTVEVATAAVTRWTRSEVGGLNPDSFASPTLVQFPSFDKKKIPAWFYKPTKPQKTPMPVIINIHGGPEAQSMAWFDPTVQYWVNELGAAVLLPNVRGSRGYGKTYLTLDNGKKREDSVKDIGALLDWIGTQKDLDKTRVAVYGGSYGGYMVLASLVHYGNRLKCGVDIVGISNFVTFLENTEDYRKDLRRVEYGDERDPAMRTFLTGISPSTHAAKIIQPLFVAQGRNDPRVPVTESEQIVKTVRGNSRKVWYMLARDEGHGFQKKRNRDSLTQASALFLEQNLLP